MGIVREAVLSDLVALKQLIKRSYDQLLIDDYAPALIDQALPFLTKPPVDLIRLGQYYVYEEDGVIYAAGGWARQGSIPSKMPQGYATVRMLVADPDHVRRGCASEIFNQVIAASKLAGLKGLYGPATRNSLGFFRNKGFVLGGDDVIDLAGDKSILFPVIWLKLDY